MALLVLAQKNLPQIFNMGFPFVLQHPSIKFGGKQPEDDASMPLSNEFEHKDSLALKNSLSLLSFFFSSLSAMTPINATLRGTDMFVEAVGERAKDSCCAFGSDVLMSALQEQISAFIQAIKNLHFTATDLKHHLESPPTLFSVGILRGALEKVQSCATSDVLTALEASSCVDEAAQSALVNLADLAFLHAIQHLQVGSSPSSTMDVLKLSSLWFRCPRSKDGYCGRTEGEARVWFARKLFMLSLSDEPDEMVCVEVTLACDQHLAPSLRVDEEIVRLQVQFWCFMAQKHCEPSFLGLADGLMAQFDKIFPPGHELRALYLAARSQLDLDLILRSPSLQGDPVARLQHLKQNLLSLIEDVRLSQSMVVASAAAHVALAAMEVLQALPGSAERDACLHIEGIVCEFFATLRKGFCWHQEFWCIRFELALATAKFFAPDLSIAAEDCQKAERMWQRRMLDSPLRDLMVPPTIRYCLAQYAHHRRFNKGQSPSVKSWLLIIKSAIERKDWNLSLTGVTHMWFDPTQSEMIFLAKRTLDLTLPLVEEMFRMEGIQAEHWGNVAISMPSQLVDALAKLKASSAKPSPSCVAKKLLEGYKSGFPLELGGLKHPEQGSL